MQINWKMDYDELSRKAIKDFVCPFVFCAIYHITDFLLKHMGIRVPFINSVSQMNALPLPLVNSYWILQGMI